MPSYASLTLVIVYLLFLLYRIGLLIRKWSKAQAFRRAAFIVEPSPVLASIAARCEQAFHLNNVTLSFSRSAPAPGTVGALTPVIVLPAGSNADTSEEILATMVGHEMAHIARRDYALNLVYEFLIVPISFHPVALAIKRQIGRTRELACDDLVTGRLLEAEDYARSLVGMAGTLVPRTGQALTLGVIDADILEERIMKLTQDTKRLGKTASNVISLCCLCFLFLTGVAASSFSLELRTSDPQISQRAPHNINDASRESADGSGAFVQDSNATRAAAHPLTNVSSSDDAQARAEAACAAAKARDFGAIPYLILMLADDTSIQAGTCLEEGRWSPALHRLKHPSPGEQAAIALASMGTPALEPLTKALGSGRRAR
jgi:beta-lactamase regulating signal transducer with metallopeptidase domain